MAVKSKEYTHGGSAGKNIWLLLRAILNLVAFAALWGGFARMESGTAFSFICLVAGGAGTVFCLFVNLIFPFLHRVK